MSENEKPVIDIVLTVWNRPEMTKRCIDYISARTFNHRLIVVDNGSDNLTREILSTYRDFGVIHDLVLLGENRGLEPAKNIGLSLVRSDLFVSADNDCLVREGWLEDLADLINRYPEYAAIACRTQVMIGTGNIFDGHEDKDILEFGHPGGSFRIMRTAPVKEAGGWRDNVLLRGQEERYICGKLHERGYKTGFAVKVRCFHLFGQGKHDWGYTGMKPEEHGHSEIAHPALDNPDDEECIDNWLGVSND